MVGTTLAGKYRLTGALGQGGMGVVYAGEHVGTGDRVAVKVLHGHLVGRGGEGDVRQSLARRFQREAEAARAIDSDHIVRVLDAGTDDATGLLYLVTERLEGEDLQRLLDRVGTLSTEGALRVASQALAGLEAAHAAHVVHRDIKPANIFLASGRDGALTVKLLDFGIAKVRADPLAHTADLTTTAAFLGSPLYMSPEQVQNSRDVDHRTDVWSLGCVLYAALAGRAPQQHLATVGQLLVATCTSPPPPLTDVAPWVPAEVAEVVHAALQIDLDARFQTAAAMLAAIRRLVAGDSLAPETLASSGDRPPTPVSPLGSGSPRPAARASSHPPQFAFKPSGPDVVVAADLGLGRPVRGDETTEHAHAEGGVNRPARAWPTASTTLRSGPGDGQAPTVARSAVPAVGAKAGARTVTVDPRRFLGEQSELWTYSLDVHRHLSSLVARIWKSLRRAGARVPPMSYGTEWVLFEPRTGRAIPAEPEGDGTPRRTLEEAGIRPGTLLWLLRPDAVPPPR